MDSRTKFISSYRNKKIDLLIKSYSSKFILMFYFLFLESKYINVCIKKTG